MEEALRRTLAGASRRVHAVGWVAGHVGNLSIRLGEGRFLCTPTSVSKGDVTPEMLLVVDASGRVLQGTRRVFSEWALHAAAYAARPDVGAVLHAHPPTATGFAAAGITLEAPFLAEPVVSLGARVLLVPWHPPGDPAEATALAEALLEADAVLLAQHGALTVGADVEACVLRMELLEHLCRVARVARELGGPRPLPADHVAALLEKRAAAGLGPPAEHGSAAIPPVAAGVSPGEGACVVEEALRRFR